MRTRLSLGLAFALLLFSAPLAEEPKPQLQAQSIAVYFSPNGGCTDAIVASLRAAKQSVLVQAYSFTSAPIAEALVNAHRRGVKV